TVLAHGRAISAESIERTVAYVDIGRKLAIERGDAEHPRARVPDRRVVDVVVIQRQVARDADGDRRVASVPQEARATRVARCGNWPSGVRRELDEMAVVVQARNGEACRAQNTGLPIRHGVAPVAVAVDFLTEEPLAVARHLESVPRRRACHGEWLCELQERR